MNNFKFNNIVIFHKTNAIFVSILCVLFFAAHSSQAQTAVVKHEIEILHPGLDYAAKQKKTLLEIQDSSGKAIEYYLDVESVICEDHRCKIEKVRLYWDKYGFYTKFELPKGVILEKAEGKPFTPEDYKRLQTILLDLHSPIRYYYRDKIIDIGHGSTEGVDAVSGATTMVDKNAIVEGATWTTVTLWHWANGAIIPIIRKITAGEYTHQELYNGFESGTYNYKVLAIEQWTKNKVYEDKTTALVLSQAKDANSTKVIIDYIENAPVSVFYESLKKIVPNAEKEERILFLNSLFSKKEIASPEFYNWLSTQLVRYKTYQELQLLLRILESKKAVNDFVINEAIPLLNDPQFLTARSVYWFLQNKELSSSQKDKLENFRKKNSDKL